MDNKSKTIQSSKIILVPKIADIQMLPTFENSFSLSIGAFQKLPEYLLIWSEYCLEPQTCLKFSSDPSLLSFSWAGCLQMLQCQKHAQEVELVWNCIKNIQPDLLWEDMLVLFRRPWTSFYSIQILLGWISLGSHAHAWLTYKNIFLIHEK